MTMQFILIDIHYYTLLLLLISIILIAYWLPIDCLLIAIGIAIVVAIATVGALAQGQLLRQLRDKKEAPARPRETAKMG